MLNALELAGFKSFPDRTRFDFPAGITVIVGPNGSGKSNIVDAIKWVLGEQSARSLRGKEMADVIFKGSGGQAGRKPANSAEATLFIDNASRRLRIEADEVRVTRRVYRSGEGEYLINGEPCRLKDIRSLFRGSGIGTDAYSLIEQGKVDQLLAASPKDRRAMFEEAAGISRFKAKKVETERRLLRVEQNLTRLADIVQEVETNYRRVKTQATKAAKYKELTERLRALRTHVGWKDWRDFSHTLQQLTARGDSLRSEIRTQQEHLVTVQHQSAEVEQRFSEQSKQSQLVQTQVNQLMQAIAQQSTAADIARARLEQGEQRAEQLRDQIHTVQAKLGDAERNTAASQHDLQTASQSLDSVRLELQGVEHELAATLSSITELKRTVEANRTHIGVYQESINATRGRLALIESQLSVSDVSRDKLLLTMRELKDVIQTKSEQLQAAKQQQAEWQKQAEQRDTTLKATREELDKRQHAFESVKQRLAQLQREQAAAKQRSEIIHELEKQQEGFDAGVKDLLQRVQRKENDSDDLADVIGLVADLIRVEVEHAALIDLALGERAQYVVVKGSALIQGVAQGKVRLGGRVGLIQLHPDRTNVATERVLQDVPGVVGRLDQLVEVKPEHHGLIRHLLGQTWLVKSLDLALELFPQTTNPTTRLITLEGDIIETDGSIICGSKIRSTGIVSRRSELRELHHINERLSREIADTENEAVELESEIKQKQAQLESLLHEHVEVSEKLSESRATTSVLQREIDTAQEREATTSQEVEDLLAAISDLNESAQQNRNELLSLEKNIQDCQVALDAAVGQLHVADQRRDQLQNQLTLLKVTFAKHEQQYSQLSSRIESLNTLCREYSETRAMERKQLADIYWTSRRAKAAIAESNKVIANLESQQTELESQLQHFASARSEFDNQRNQCSETLNRTRDLLSKLQEELHRCEMREQDLSLQRSQLAARLKEDYDIDIEALSHDAGELDGEREQIDHEINDLRAKLNNIGPVNMDALHELESLESRYLSLDQQYKDLVEAKATLERIIVRINADSRRLFVDTLESIRTNFQQLFRQTFGGGSADLIIEEGVDVLEAGIDIRATPPGKPEFSNSLLSGGEKALAAVSLMMAIFKFRPSPFCILDEVDAPFDEANIGRFVGVLQSFLDMTKFVIVTHSKKTMTAANTLYGITMQESGVSKRVSVRFEDVNDQGEISDNAARRKSNADSLERSA
ncbi:MAG TPA: chromosome segregation protein SMC [Pirellulaceae bacterium]|nr:chromosome segregation protein SMC [Pirellulaceae bacterium]HMO91155.1 chromosome segregation protein SMC [Pirellulaceae bacterium]HMP69075.1 chromosome segregation protein SMC [Pirellulaceae bacterium]